MAERRLEGGLANAGLVVRSGDYVLRPSNPHSHSLHAFLRAIIEAGFEGAPSPIGIDSDGRERLTFIEGDVPLVPYPAWSQTDGALASLARLVRSLHDASRTFDARGHTWNNKLSDPLGGLDSGPVLCHNDIELSNVVFRDGVAIALIDFEFAAPGRAVHELAHLARLCVPFEDNFDQERMGWIPADRPARLRLIADEYGLEEPQRAELLPAVDSALHQIETVARRSVDEADPRAQAMVAQSGGIEKYERRRQWWQRHRHKFAAALQ